MSPSYNIFRRSHETTHSSIIRWLSKTLWKVYLLHAPLSALQGLLVLSCNLEFEVVCAGIWVIISTFQLCFPFSDILSLNLMKHNNSCRVVGISIQRYMLTYSKLVRCLYRVSWLIRNDIVGEYNDHYAKTPIEFQTRWSH